MSWRESEPYVTPISDKLARAIFRRSMMHWNLPKEFLVDRETYRQFVEEQSRSPLGYRNGMTFYGVKIIPDV